MYESWFVIPARKGSNTVPNKNRVLLKYTIKQIPEDVHNRTIVTTNDEFIIDKLSKTNINILKRSDELSGDAVSMKYVMQDVVDKFKIQSDDTIILLELTYPQRTFNDVQDVYKFYKRHNARSVICCTEPETHPFLCFYREDGFRGRQIVEHDLFRRQDYPECLAINHFVCIFTVSELNRLNKQLYNENTLFYKIKTPIDIDTVEDLQKIYKS